MSKTRASQYYAAQPNASSLLSIYNVAAIPYNASSDGNRKKYKDIRGEEENKSLLQVRVCGMKLTRYDIVFEEISS